MMAMPTMALYSASKFALEGACEALWYEARPWNIHVTLIQPGFVNSRSFENTLYTPESRAASKQPRDPYHGHYVNMTRLIHRLMNRSRATPDEIARRVHRVIRHPNPPLRVGVTSDASFFRMLRRLLPRRIYHALLYRGLPRIQEWGKAGQP
jgi:short-subunit dehydrogenase